MADDDATTNKVSEHAGSNIDGEGGTDVGGGPDPSYQKNDHELEEEEGLTCGILPRTVKGELFRISDDRTIDFHMNPTTMSLSILIIWTFTIWCALDENSGETIQEWQIWIVRYWTWFYVFGLICMGCFTTFLLFSRFGDIKLGPKDEPPRFSIGSWFAMLFSAGVGVGLYFYGVAEPVAHYVAAKAGDNRYYTDGDNLERALDAMNISWFHWGLTASSVYCVVGLPLAYFTHVKNAPLKFSSAFVPLLGKKYANGFVGDLIDTFAVVGTMFGVATSLGLGVIQLNAMLNFMDPDSFENEDTNLRIVIIWVITLFATISVFTGLDVGIRRLSEGNFAFCLILLIYLFLICDPFYLTNLFIQTAGYHIQNLVQVTFFTDAFQQAGFAEDEEFESFMSWWTVFYWGWWIAWSPFVGIFIAQISRGRTIREFILGNMFVPTLFTSVWLTVFGGIGLYNELAFDGINGDFGQNVTCPGSYEFERMDLNYTTMAPTNMPTMSPTMELNYTWESNMNDTFDTSAYGRWRGNNVVYLECFATETMLFEMIDQFPLGSLMNVLAGIGIVTYFVTSSDSASHVIDVLTANGNQEPPKIQRIFWAMSEGAVASVLLSIGGTDALSALQTVSIASGLPFCAILLALCYAFYYALRVDTGEIILEERETWVLDYLDSTNPQITCNGAHMEYFTSCLRATIIPCWENWINYKAVAEKDTQGRVFSQSAGARILWQCMFFGTPLLMVLCWCLGGGLEGWGYVGLTFYVFFVVIGAWNRSRIRAFYGIAGSSMCDFLAHLCCAYPWSIAQEQAQIASHKQGMSRVPSNVKPGAGSNINNGGTGTKDVELVASAQGDNQQETGLAD